MSEEKLYVVEDDNRLHLAFNDAGKPMWFQTGGNFTATDSVASMWSLKHGGHVVTLVEEPKKVVLSKEQAEIVDAAHNSKRPASYIILRSNDEELLMNAYVNGYIVEKEKKYRVLAPKSWWYDEDAPLYLLFSFTEGMRFTVKKDNPSTVFTKEQLSAFGLDGEYFVKEEVTDDAD